MMPGGPRRTHKVNDQYRIPKPKSVKEVPNYLKTVATSFFKRLIYIYKLVWEANKFMLIAMVFLAVLEGVMPIATTYVASEFLNVLARVMTKEITRFADVYPLLIVQSALFILSQVVLRLYNVTIRISGELVSNHIRKKIMLKSREIDLSSYDNPEFYAKLENANREAGMRPVETLRSSLTMFSAMITLVGFIVALWSVSWWAVFLVVGCSAPSAIVAFIYRRKNVNYFWYRSKERRQMNYYSGLLVNKDYVKEIRMYDMADDMIGRYNNVFSRYYAGIKKLIMGENNFTLIANFIHGVATCFLFIYIAYGVYLGKYMVGDFAFYNNGLRAISTALSTMISTTATIYEGTLFINNLITYLEEKQTIVSSLPEAVTPNRHIGHTIEFKNVSFHYPGVDFDVIHNVNLKINSGETVVIVGLNGAGKTTLIKLLTRLYDPTQGEILLDGRNIKEYDTKALYEIFGIIFQDFGKYAMTVSENIWLGNIKKGMDNKEIQLAAQQANATEFIEKLPKGFETPLMRWFEDDGIEPSIGQWQKLSIARAFYSDSDILILDEPTASLDPIAEQEIFNEFDSLRQDKTTIFVSHRLSSATIADKIVVLEYGKIVEVGNHSQLMNHKGKYYELFSTQAKRYVTPVDEKDTLEQN